MSKDNGGSAFPRMPGETPGLSLRDYMAIHASEYDVQAIMREHTKRPMVAGKYMDVCSVTLQQARYIHADAMLSERNK